MWINGSLSSLTEKFEISDQAEWLGESQRISSVRSMNLDVETIQNSILQLPAYIARISWYTSARVLP